MEIKQRMGLPRMPFHVMNRGARKISIFADNDDRRLFVHLMAQFALKHEIKIIAWSLMPNHYHMEPESEGTPLCRMMHDLDGAPSVLDPRTGCRGVLRVSEWRVGTSYRGAVPVTLGRSALACRGAHEC